MATNMDNEYKEVKIQFTRGLVDHVFEGKEGTQYAEINIPNKDPEDRTPWESFVVPADKVYEGKNENSLYIMMPEGGSTTVRRPVLEGQREDGTNQWGFSDRKVPNTELKNMVGKTRASLKHKIADLSDKVQKREAAKEVAKVASKSKNKAVAI